MVSSTRPVPSARATEVRRPAPFLSVVVPAYNEERRIGESMRRIGAYLASQPYASEVVAVDDGSEPASQDALNAAVTALPRTVRGRVLRLDTNQGKGAAVREGCLAAEGRYVAFLDADLATPAEELPRLLDALDRGADIAIGVRNQEDGSDMRERRGFGRRLAGAAFSLAMNRLLPEVKDSQCPLKAFRMDSCRQLFARQQVRTWAFDAELLFIARKLGLTVHQVPVQWQDIEDSKLRLNLRTLSEPLNLARIWWIHRRLGRAGSGEPTPALWSSSRPFS